MSFSSDHVFDWTPRCGMTGKPHLREQSECQGCHQLNPCFVQFITLLQVIGLTSFRSLTFLMTLQLSCSYRFVYNQPLRFQPPRILKGIQASVNRVNPLTLLSLCTETLLANLNFQCTTKAPQLKMHDNLALHDIFWPERRQQLH